MEIISWLFVIGSALAVAWVCLWIGHLLVVRTTLLHTPVFVPISDDNLAIMLSLPKIRDHARLLDMGSGDGKLVIALAQRFPTCSIVGVELNLFLVRKSINAVKIAKLEDRVAIIHQNFWKTDLSSFDVIFLYGTSYIMKKLEEKVILEMHDGAQFVSTRFYFPTLISTQTVGEVRLYRR